MPPSLHEDIRQRFGLTLIGIDAETASKGEDVFRAGRVQSRVGVHGKRDAVRSWKLEAEVTGSRGELYRTSVSVRRDDAQLRASSSCTCPVTRQCKHAAATLIAWLQDRDALGPEERPEAAGGDVAQQRSRALFQRQHALHWARELNSVKISGTAGDGVRTSLCYVLEVQERGARLSVYRTRRLKVDEPLRHERYAAFGELALNPPSFWDDVDVSVALSMLQQERSSGFSQLLTGPRAGDSLLLLAQAGRLFLDQPPRQPGDRALEPGPPLAAQLAWEREQESEPEDGEPPDGEAPVRLGLDVAPPAVPVYCTRPCYLDRSARTLGPLVMDEAPPPSMMRWLREAPLVSADAAPEVALALHASLLSRPALRRRLPPLPRQVVREAQGTPRFVLGLFTTGSTPLRPRPRPGAGNRSFMAISLAVEYGGVRTEPLRLSTIAVQTAEGPLLVVCDRQAEEAALAMLRDTVTGMAWDEAGLTLAPHAKTRGGGMSASSGWLTVAALPADGIAAARIKHGLADMLEKQGWMVVDQADLPTSLLSASDLVVDLQTGTDPAGAPARAPVGAPAAAAGAPSRAEGRNTPEWFRLQSGIQVGDRRIDLAPVLAAVMAMGGFDAWKRACCPQGELWMRVSDTEVVRVDAARIEPLARVVASWAQLRDEDAEAPALLLSPFAAAQLAESAGTLGLPEPVRKLRAWFESFEGLQPIQAPPSFRSALRPYQSEGLAWLQFLARAGLGGILADDMGLGKTVQVLAHIELERSTGRLAGPVLVVAPTSVVFNWQAEAARHAPALRLLALTGADRSKRFGELGEHDVVLTSYALLPRDAAVLRGQQWHAVVLDEAQMIKNPRTQGAAAVRQLAAGHRIALTGTPLENHLGELWSLMHFVLPGLLGAEEAFRSRFRNPIEKHPGTETARERLAALNTRVRPFMLRRTKQAVLADLPLLTEMIQRVELPTDQRDLYESIRAAMDKRVRQALAQAGLARSQIVLLDALLKLRQACCDPALVKLPGARQVTRSAKRDALIELLATLVDEGRKALVFSQFTSMLDLIEVAIDADPRLAPVVRARLDGDTADRAGAVTRFQEGDARIFLLSLKAGGVGLNLTAADTVIHYDPWWNPAVENQATDRAHRIGQEKPVFVYKLIAAGTVEERILALQARKAELAAAVLSGSLSAGGKPLTPEDLLGLFEPL